MSKLNRRTAMTAALVSGASVVSVANPAVANTSVAQELTRDQEFVMAAGMTKDEAECWKKVAEAAGAFFKLEALHPTDRQEVATAIHVIQNKLLGRPTYRKYLELAKAAHEKKEDK